MAQRRLTSELLEQLLASATPEAYLAAIEPEDRTLAGYLRDLLVEKGLTRAEAIRASGLNATFGYQLFQGTRRAGRDHAIMLAFGLRCTLDEAQHLLRFAGVSELWCKVRRDAVIIFCLDRGLSRQECDDELFALGERTLLGDG